MHTLNKVLIVDDDEKYSRFAERVVGRFYRGHITVADTFELAEILLKNEGPFDLCIFENEVPPLRNAALELIKTAVASQVAQPKFIVHSAQLSPTTLRDIQPYGAVFATKDVRSRVLEEAIRELIS